MNNYLPYATAQPAQYQPYQAAQYFPQPQGSVYMINSANDISSVPVGAGVSVAICQHDGVLYLKTIQNGAPVLIGYRLLPIEGTDGNGSAQETPTCETDKKITAVLKDYGERLEKIEQFIQQKPVPAEKPKGGVSGWQL